MSLLRLFLDRWRSNAGKVCECNNCGESITVPTLKQAEYAKRKQRETKQEEEKFERQLRKLGIWIAIPFVAICLFLIFHTVVDIIYAGTPPGRALDAAEEYTKRKLNYPDTATLIGKEIIETKPGDHFLIKVAWKAKNAFGVEGKITLYVVVNLNVKDGTDNPTAQVLSRDNPPPSW